MLVLPPGVRHMPGFLSSEDQRSLLDQIRAVVKAAPLYVPTMPKTGKPMSVRMTNCGSLGWVTDKEHGYRYQATHPVTGDPWPPIPERLMALWREVASYPAEPEACLVNFYDASAKMGLHQDRDETEFRRAGRVGLAGRFMPVSRRRQTARRSDKIVSAGERRRGRAGRRGPSRLSRRRPHLCVDLGAAEKWRPDQPDAAPGDAFAPMSITACAARLPR